VPNYLKLKTHGLIAFHRVSCTKLTHGV